MGFMIRFSCYSLLIWAFSTLFACAEDNGAEADASDVGENDATDGVRDGADAGVQTQNFRAIAISEVLDRDSISVRSVLDLGGDRWLSTLYSELRASDDGGETWHVLDSPFTLPNEQVFGSLTYNDATGSVFAYSSAYRLYRTQDKGETFQEMKSPFAPDGNLKPGALAATEDGTLWALANRVQFAEDEYGLAVSTDDGETFQSVSMPSELYDENAQALTFFPTIYPGFADNVFVSIENDRLYRRSIDSEWKFIDGIDQVEQHFIADPGMVLMSFREIETNTYKVALSTDQGDTFSIDEGPGVMNRPETYAQLDDGTILWVNRVGQLSVLSAEATWTVAVNTYPETHESPSVREIKVRGDSLTLTYHGNQSLSWTLGDDQWNQAVTPAVIPMNSDIVDITVTASGKAAVIAYRSNQSTVYVSDDRGATWIQGQTFDERLGTLAMKPEGDMIFVGGGGGRHWFLDGSGELPEGGEASNPLIGYDGFSLLQSVWTPKYGRESYLLVAGASADDSDGGFYRETYYTSLGPPTFVDPVQDPAFPARDNPAGFHSVSYFGETGISVGMRQYVNGANRRVRVRSANNLADWTEAPYQFYDETPPVAVATPVSMASSTSDACTMSGQIYSDGRLYNGSFPVEIVEGLSDSVPVSSIAFNDVECGPDGALWLGTSFGLFRLERLP